MILYLIFVLNGIFCRSYIQSKCEKGNVTVKDLDDNLITIDCPNGTECGISNGRAKCININKSIDDENEDENKKMDEDDVDDGVPFTLIVMEEVDDKKTKIRKVNPKTINMRKRKKKPKTDEESESSEENLDKRNKKNKQDDEDSEFDKPKKGKKIKRSKRKKIKKDDEDKENKNEEVISLLKDLKKLIQSKEKEVVTVTEKTGPKEIKLEYTTGDSKEPIASFKADEASKQPPGAPTKQPSGQPTPSTGKPSTQPTPSTGQPTPSTGQPSGKPFGQPTPSTGQPSAQPTPSTGQPSKQSSSQPSKQPSGQPTPSTDKSKPSSQPTPSTDKSTDKSKSGSSGGDGKITSEKIMNACSKMGDEPNPEYLDAVAEGINEKSEEELPFDMKVQALGQFGHESGCFKFIEEIDCKDNKCPDKYGADQGAPGKQYYGRGFIQLSWPDNYKAASQAINNDLSFFEQPELVAEPKNAILTSLWFWMERVMTAENVGPEHFGYSTKAINGELECTGQNVDKSKKRYEYYKAFAEELGLEKIADEVGCY